MGLFAQDMLICKCTCMQLCCLLTNTTELACSGSHHANWHLLVDTSGRSASTPLPAVGHVCAETANELLGPGYHHRPHQSVLQAPLDQLAEDPDLHVRELAFAALQYALATAENPAHFDALYNHGLVLQELSSKLPAASAEQASMLRQVCSKPAQASGWQALLPPAFNTNSHPAYSYSALLSMIMCLFLGK